ncbi:MAG TPA: GNAT family N-acetyltransferase [Aestuariivirgaceae bacterium]|nr:GNAT family N-acetyltransferase [Aestuariivirgaceae bacterium]
MIVRKLTPWEWEALRAHLLRLGPEERRMRFCRPVSDAAIHAYCDRIDRPRTTILGCFIDGALRAVAELILIPDEWPMNAEIALSVEKPFQRQGIGGRLLGQVLLVARNRLIRTVHLISLSENEAMQHLAREFGASIEVHVETAQGRIGLAWPSYLSLVEELSADGHALIGAVFELSAKKAATG